MSIADEQALHNHAGWHSRTLPIESCNEPNCKAYTRRQKRAAAKAVPQVAASPDVQRIVDAIDKAQPFRLEDAPRIVCLDVPEDATDKLRFVWRLVNVALDELGFDTRERFSRDGLHTLVLHCLNQLESEGVEGVMNDLDNQLPRD